MVGFVLDLLMNWRMDGKRECAKWKQLVEGKPTNPKQTRINLQMEIQKEETHKRGQKAKWVFCAYK